jgi:threonine/homoserine/homoserine lactone efflux protein
VALIVANSLRYGFSNGAMTALGITLGNAVQLLFVLVGLTAIVELAADAMSWIRWAGVVYLVYLGVRTWNEPAGPIGNVTAAPAMFWRGFLIAVVNPKTLLFIAAFLPQFVSPAGSIAGQFAAVGAVFLAVLLAGDVGWALGAASARRVFDRFEHVRNRVTGGFLIVAGAGLALARR